MIICATAWVRLPITPRFQLPPGDANSVASLGATRNPFVSRRKLSLQPHQSTVQHAADGSRSLTANVTWQVTDTAKALQLFDHYDQAVRQRIDEALAETGGSGDPERFKRCLEQHLGEIGASVRQAELRTGRVAL